MNRRDAVLALAALGAAPLATRAQQAPRVARIGYLSPTSASAKVEQEIFDASRAGLRDLGCIEGKNLQIDPRYADNDSGRLPALAAGLVGLKVDVIVTYAQGVIAARGATATIPIVMAASADPVALGFAASLARPGGTVTGSAFFYFELMAKRLELLKEIKPTLKRVGLVLPANTPTNAHVLASMRSAAKALKLELHPIEVHGPAEFDSAFSTLAKKKIQGLVVSDNVLFIANLEAIAVLTAKHRLAAIGPHGYPALGGLMSYAVDYLPQFRRAAYFVDKILKSEKPGDLPIEQAMRFQYILNFKTATALGLKVPMAVLMRADEVIR